MIAARSKSMSAFGAVVGSCDATASLEPAADRCFCEASDVRVFVERCEVPLSDPVRECRVISDKAYSSASQAEGSVQIRVGARPACASPARTCAIKLPGHKALAPLVDNLKNVEEIPSQWGQYSASHQSDMADRHSCCSVNATLSLVEPWSVKNRDKVPAAFDRCSYEYAVSSQISAGFPGCALADRRRYSCRTMIISLRPLDFLPTSQP